MRNRMQTKFFICFALYAVYVDSEPTSHVGQTGKEIKLKCPSVNGEVSWKYNDANIFTIDKTGRKSIGNLNVAKRANLYGTSLAISNLQPEDKGTFICVITQRNGNQITFRHNLIVLTVSVSVNPGSPLLASRAAMFTCTASESPTNMTWKHKGEIYDMKPMELSSVKTSHAGKWTCQVSYADKIFEESLDIDVIDLEKHDTVSVKLGQKVDLPCTLTKSNFGSLDVVGGGWKQLSPASADASWLPSLDTSNPKELRWNGDTSKKVTFSKEKLGTNLGITLIKVGAEQVGKYRCYIEFKDRGNLTADVILVIEGVLPDTPSEAYPGKSPPSWLGLNMWIWVGVGAGSVVIIALMVAIVFVHRSNRRKKMRMRKLKSVRKPLTPNDYCQCNHQPRGHNMDRAARVPRQQRIPENIQINGGHGRRSRM